MKQARIGILPGDGIGPEIMAEACKVMQALERQGAYRFTLVPLAAGGDAYERYGCHLPEETLHQARGCDALLKGPFGGPPQQAKLPKWAGLEEKAILPLRKQFELFANLRPVTVYPDLHALSPVKPHLLNDVDLLIVRELTSGLYFGEKTETFQRGDRVHVDTEAYAESEIRRIAVRAYELARGRRRKVTLVAKANVMTSGRLWQEVTAAIASAYPDVESDYLHADHAAMRLIQQPSQFDVLLTSNLFGDILSDEAAVLPGSIGLLPSACLGTGTFGLYEPIHGSAPDLAGQEMANPIGMIRCVALMLRHTFEDEATADLVEHAVRETLREGWRTPDLFMEGSDDPTRRLPTAAMGDRIAALVATGE
ncbi:3-isopropylmalate dehydrogenase [Paenibacillus sp. J31TS4]|uniref:3-isopropylmalate dehydrogenase n=1 Tax=Paenibacillus sp. J31TS4 TaxID=2807195 RepID=UPI001B058817|nr:3-isopropylmalate dehydrogenase [Paenibacillus sp. J31TS4]GIP37197.1 3-isopropylmalate dehydrogenase [Paenibacillus sp. J31TS4]